MIPGVRLLGTFCNGIPAISATFEGLERRHLRGGRDGGCNPNPQLDWHKSLDDLGGVTKVP